MLCRNLMLSTVTPAIILISLFQLTQSRTKDYRIYGGSQALKYHFPYIVSISHVIRERNLTDCSAVIIDQFHLLTAAHCLLSNFENYIVTPNYYSTRRFDQETGEYLGPIQYQISRVYLNANYSETYDELVNDIGLIRLSRPIQFDEFVQPIKVYAGPLKPGTILTVAGWGYRENEQSARALYNTQVELYPPNVCDAWAYSLSKLWFPWNFCAGHPSRASCYGDSGGPIVIRGHYPGEDVLIGIVSGALGMVCAKEPNIYSNITHFIGWIEERLPHLTILTKLPESIVIRIN